MENSNTENLSEGYFIEIDEYQIKDPEDLQSFITEIQTSNSDSDLFARFEHFGNVVLKINEITEEWTETFSITKTLEQKPPRILGDTLQSSVYNAILQIQKKEDLEILIHTYSGILKDGSKLDEYINSLN